LNQGVQSKDFFGVAQGKEGDRYPGFVYGKPTSVILDGSCLLIEPSAASDYAEALRAKEAAASATSTMQPPGDLIHDTPTGSSGGTGAGAGAGAVGGSSGSVDVPVTKALPTQFYASAELDPVKAKMQFATLVDEVIQQFTAKHGVNVTISIDIQASSAGGFDDSVQRSVKENCSVLKVNTYEFE
ncbi:ATP-binding protein, partial [Pseudomonas aeruginosa]